MNDTKTPTWAWLFAIACVFLPLLIIALATVYTKLDGLVNWVTYLVYYALAIIVGAKGALHCWSTARNKQQSTEKRFLICVVATLGTWVGIYFLIICWTVVLLLTGVWPTS